jgi:TolB protein
LIIILGAVTAIISACGGTATPTASPAVVATQSLVAQAKPTASCPDTVKKALETVAGKCNAIGPNSICYGNPAIDVALNGSGTNFKAPGDVAPLSAIKTIHTAPYDPATGAWGIAVMKAAVNLPGTTAGQQVTLVMYGDAQLDAFGGDMQTVSIRTGVGTQACDQLPPSGVTVQVPKGLHIKFTVNNVQIALGSTAVITADPNSEIEVAVLEGQAEVTALGATVEVPAGRLTGVPLKNGVPTAAPGAIEVINYNAIKAVPISLLEQPVSMQAVQSAIEATQSLIATPVATTITLAPNATLALTLGATQTPLLTWTPKPTLGQFTASGTNRIAYASKQNDQWDIYIVTPDGSAPIKLTARSGDNRAPAWSPEGSRIAFAGFTGAVYQIYTLTDTGQALTPLTGPDGSAGHPTWSPDGSQIAFDFLKGNNRDIAVVDTGGGNLKLLASNPADDSTPAWSPDGKQIAFVSNRDGNKELYVVNVDGSGVKRLTDNPADDSAPAWSPDGKQIAFVSNRSGGDDIWVMNADGSGSPTRLVANPSNDEAPTWSPDGKQIAFVSDREGTKAIYVIEVSNGTTKRLTDLSVDSDEPAWQH